MRRTIAPIVHDGQPRDGEDVLQLRKMITRRTLPRGRCTIRGPTAFYLHDPFAVQGEAVETRPLPRPREALHTRRLHHDGHRAAVERPRLPLACRASRLLKMPCRLAVRL